MADEENHVSSARKSSLAAAASSASSEEDEEDMECAEDSSELDDVVVEGEVADVKVIQCTGEDPTCTYPDIDVYTYLEEFQVSTFKARFHTERARWCLALKR